MGRREGGRRRGEGEREGATRFERRERGAVNIEVCAPPIIAGAKRKQNDKSWNRIKTRKMQNWANY
jgi:hypothetical protein